MNDSPLSVQTPAEAPSGRDERQDNVDTGPLAALHHAVAGEARRAFQAVHGAVTTRVRAAITEAAATHDELATAARAPSDGDAWTRVVEYRRAVAERVLAPVLSVLQEANLGAAVDEDLSSGWAALSALTDSFPERVVLQEDPALYEPAPGDSQWRRIRKGLERLRARFRKRARERAVPLRTLVDYHLRARIPQLMASPHAHLQQQVARAVAALETAITEWVYATLDAELRLDGVARHQPRWMSRRTPAPEPPSETQPHDGVPDQPIERATAMLAAGCADALSALPKNPTSADELDAAAREELARDVRAVGTLLLSVADRTATPQQSASPSPPREQRRAWTAWHERSVNRLRLDLEYLRLRERLLTLENQLLDRTAGATLRPTVEAFARLEAEFQQAHDAAVAEHQGTSAATGAEGLVDRLRGIQQETTDALVHALRDLPRTTTADPSLSDPGRTEWNQLGAWAAELPDRLPVHPWQYEPDADIDPDSRTTGLDLRQLAEDALAPPWPQQLSGPVDPFKRRLTVVWNEAERVRDIVRYNIDSAVDELESALAEGSGPHAVRPVRAAIEASSELVPDALRRSMDTFRDLSASLQDPWDAFARAVHETFVEDWNDLHRRFRAEDVLAERWVGIQTKVTRQAELWWRRAQVWHRAGVARSRTWLGVAQRQVRVLLDRGRSAVTATDDAEESFNTLNTVATARQLLGGFPLVYRRLFSFEPVTDPSFLEGRGRDLVQVRRHFEYWSQGTHPGVLVLAAPLGSGRTSFLNVARTRIFDGCRVATLSLGTRLLDPDDVAQRLATVLQLDAPSIRTLRELEETLLRQSRTDPPTVCVLDNLEHLLLQEPRGTDLLERVLMLFAKTDSSVYWLAAVGNVAWQFVERTAPEAAALATTLVLDPLEPDELEAIIESRHGRTGMPVRFATPAALSPIVRQRLRRARTEERRQRILRSEFFDDLHRLSGQDVMLALFLWLRSADFEAEPDTLTVNPIEPLRFRFLNSFDLTRTFTLRAFVSHNTLTVEEHMRIFRMSAEQSVLTLEPLLDLRLIERIPSEGSRDDAAGHGRIVPGERYRLRRLVLHPVTEFLQGKNIIY